MNAILEVNGNQEVYSGEVSDLEKMLLFVMNKDVLNKDLIVEVKVDGEVFSEEFEHQARVIGLDKVKKIEIFTQTAQAFAQDSINQIHFVLDPLKRGFLTAAKSLGDPDTEKDGYELFVMSIETLRSLKCHFDNSRNILMDNSRSSEFRELWNKLDNIVDNFINDREMITPNSIADCIKNQMVPLLDKWESYVA